MAHWAELNDDNYVIRVIAVSNDKPNEGYDWIMERLGGRWVQTSINTLAGEHLLGGTPLRKNFAGVGFKYNESLDMFIPPSPYPSWILNHNTGQWDPPVPRPPRRWNIWHTWDEENGVWLEEEYPGE